jgi:hypothetical protein
MTTWNRLGCQEPPVGCTLLLRPASRPSRTLPACFVSGRMPHWECPTFRVVLCLATPDDAWRDPSEDWTDLKDEYPPFDLAVQLAWDPDKVGPVKLGVSGQVWQTAALPAKHAYAVQQTDRWRPWQEGQA